MSYEAPQPGHGQSGSGQQGSGQQGRPPSARPGYPNDTLRGRIGNLIASVLATLDRLWWRIRIGARVSSTAARNAVTTPYGPRLTRVRRWLLIGAGVSLALSILLLIIFVADKVGYAHRTSYVPAHTTPAQWIFPFAIALTLNLVAWLLLLPAFARASTPSARVSAVVLWLVILAVVTPIFVVVLSLAIIILT